ncbi:SGNH hydrolase domain-containing protein [Macrococcoides bohemicum]|uniref:SGNH domain-containing protein n=1 Tax=Macrococcoides bohemicum TaxID=1903056 RepID=A0A327ZZC2_9STAP|nr:SGNH hydrolase domain-containing protein [Macrococcus bohemicus]RAK47651.1 hypothetical protein BHX94_12395 [Macrococcus bohemicus]
MKNSIRVKVTLSIVLLMVFFNGVVEAYTYGKFYYHPGVQENRYEKLPYAPTLPTTSKAFDDSPQGYKDGCHANKHTSKIKVCTYGVKKGYKHTVAVIGDSHSGHWLGALQKIASKQSIRIIYATKSGCAMSSKVRKDYPTCTTWNKNLIPTIMKYKPDLVLTKADTNTVGTGEKKYDYGMVDKFKELNRYGVKVFAIKNTMYFPEDSIKCIKKYGRHSVKCKVSRANIEKNPEWLKTLKAQPNVKYVDYADLICDKKYCSPTQGNVIIVRDRHHLTNTYSKTFSYYLARDLMPFLRK